MTEDQPDSPEHPQPDEQDDAAEIRQFFTTGNGAPTRIGPKQLGSVAQPRVSGVNIPGIASLSGRIKTSPHAGIVDSLRKNGEMIAQQQQDTRAALQEALDSQDKIRAEKLSRELEQLQLLRDIATGQSQLATAQTSMTEAQAAMTEAQTTMATAMADQAKSGRTMLHLNWAVLVLTVVGIVVAIIIAILTT